MVMDKGYHSNDVLLTLTKEGYRTYISEPDRGQRNWKNKQEEKQATYANRQRIKGDRGKRLLRQRGEFLERPFAHYLEAGGMRRTHLRGRNNILKRLLVHVAGFNLGVLMRGLIGTGTPRAYANALSCTCKAFSSLVGWPWALMVAKIRIFGVYSLKKWRFGQILIFKLRLCKL